LAEIAALQGHPVLAARVLGAAEVLRAGRDYALPFFRPPYEQTVDRIRAALGDEAFAAEWAAGQALPLEEAITEILTETGHPPGQLADATGAQLSRNGLPDASAPSAHSYPDGLTERQIDYLRLLADGHTNREIAETLAVSERAVEQMLVRIYDKVGARNRAEAIRYALDHHLTTPTSG
jgi:DNA-binding NarL/FixJ family response regulator